ncbi:basic amino acid ABC transporter substrate-binding protein [Desulfosporosinus sp. BICA1-9]|uniref:basic amino acid ABC transporter substrate-binding protein n=1 Tax=Desulfosporosinus sp. BICA1-9 TaxID=1531958 RepID=UPI00054BD44E|nr:basic amino acid ABC transporter substrate-binding protein [Desulfosporosinus sp. BICA1-9]KJS50800.1 MAG: ABC transporter substrate-binding protein [Peptococcaceae bacterium BRH_c23]KJS89553.1 MAG: ABC transporter substrate-binding protein [Desulfosporosinus sp. BICA1-9]
MFKPKFRFVLAGLLSLSLLTLAGCGSTPAPAPAPTPAPAPVEKVLKVGSDIAYAPFEFMDEKQQATGFDIELINALGADMGYTKVNIETAAFDGLLPALQAGKYDCVISAMTITEKRAQSVQFSDKYFRAIQYIAMKKGAGFKNLADLKGKKVGVQLSTTGQEVVEKAGIEPRKFDTTPDAMNDLLNGGVEAVVADGPVVLWFQAQNEKANIVSVEADVEEEFYGIAMKLDNKELGDKMNASLKKLKENGKYNEIYKKWFKVDAPKF